MKSIHGETDALKHADAGRWIQPAQLTRDVSPYLVDRYSERKESAEELMRRVNLPKAV